MWSALKEVSLFFSNSPKCHQCLEGSIADRTPDVSKKKPVDLCRTQWVAHNDALTAFHQMYPAVVDALAEINSGSGWNWDSSSTATSLLSIIFTATFVVTSKIMAYTAQLAAGLQKKALNIIKAYQHVKTAMDTVQKLRASVDDYHETRFAAAVTMTSSVDVLPTIPATDKHSVAMHQNLLLLFISGGMSLFLSSMS